MKILKTLECSCGAIGRLDSEIKIQAHAFNSLFYGSPAAKLFIYLHWGQLMRHCENK